MPTRVNTVFENHPKMSHFVKWEPFYFFLSILTIDGALEIAPENKKLHETFLGIFKHCGVYKSSYFTTTFPLNKILGVE